MGTSEATAVVGALPRVEGGTHVAPLACPWIFRDSYIAYSLQLFCIRVRPGLLLFKVVH